VWNCFVSLAYTWIRIAHWRDYLSRSFLLQRLRGTGRIDAHSAMEIKREAEDEYIPVYSSSASLGIIPTESNEMEDKKRRL
jgi:hypothetical protein